MSNQCKNIESHIVLGYKCNHHCKHCVVQVKREAAHNDIISDLLFDEAIDIIYDAIQKENKAAAVDGDKNNNEAGISAVSALSKLIKK